MFSLIGLELRARVFSLGLGTGFREACEFLKIKKSTMYTYIQNGEIPVNQKGKKYTFFRDDLIKWLESGCKIEAPISTMEINQILSKRPRRRI